MSVSVINASIIINKGDSFDCGTADFLLIGVSSTTDDVSSTTFNGVSMTQIGVTHTIARGRYESLWYLVAPASGSRVVTFTGGTSSYVRCVSMLGVNPSTPVGGTATNSGTSTTPSITVTPIANGAIVICIGINGDTSTPGSDTIQLDSSSNYYTSWSSGTISLITATTININCTSNEFTLIATGVNPVSFGGNTNAILLGMPF